MRKFLEVKEVFGDKAVDIHAPVENSGRSRMATLESEQVERIIEQLEGTIKVDGVTWVMVRDRATDAPYVNAKFYPHERKLLWESVEGLL